MLLARRLGCLRPRRHVGPARVPVHRCGALENPVAELRQLIHDLPTERGCVYYASAWHDALELFEKCPDKRSLTAKPQQLSVVFDMPNASDVRGSH
jgi:hypothetical protein